jgi:hypothetical protein
MANPEEFATANHANSTAIAGELRGLAEDFRKCVNREPHQTGNFINEDD